MQLLRCVGNRRHSNDRVYKRRIRRLALAIMAGFALLASTPGIVCAQQGEGSATGQTSANEENRAERPRLLFLLQRPVGAALRREDPATQLSVALRNALDAANRYDLVLYGPDQPSIKRALLEHTIPVSDLVEPIRPEAFRRIARAIGARYTLTIRPTFDRQGVKSDLHYDEDMDGDTWRTGLTEQIGFDADSGRHHLKTADLIALTVDAVCVRLNIPSHLAANIKVGPTKVIGALKPDGKPDKPEKQTQLAQKNAAQKTPVTPTTSPDDTKPAANNSSQQATMPEKKVVKRQQPVRSTDLGPLAPPPTVAAPAPVRADYLAQAMVARKEGDLSSTITLLRRAVTAAPHDPLPRRQLIQAYQDRHMVDLALAESERAIQLMPNDNALQRLYGDALLAKGDGPSALKIYREVVRRDPSDVAAQVALADALLADNQYAEALTAYQTAAASDPNSALPHRRLARVYAGRAAADLAQYRESLKELALARQLTPGGDTDIYVSDYVALMRQMDQRLRDMADELQNNFQAAVQGTRKITEVTRTMTDLKERATAIADYLNDVPLAVGHDGTHAYYASSAALLVQAIGSFRRVLANDNRRVEEAQGMLRVARVDILHELATANKLLLATQSEPRRSLSNTSVGSSARKPASIQ